MVNFKYYKCPDLAVVILIKVEKVLELVSNLQHWPQNILEMCVTQHATIWPNLILIVLSIKKKNKQKCNFHYKVVPVTRS